LALAIEELTSRVAKIPGGVNVGVLRGDHGRCVLVDTGLNDTSAKKALKAVREEIGGEVVAILTTHAHADHFGGNATVVKRTGAKVYAPAFDEAFLRYPLLQPICLFAGADPPASMRGGFMLADPSPVDVVVEGSSLSLEGFDVQIIPLRGHSPNQVGYVADGVFFCADVVLPESVLAKYKIPYLFSVTDHLHALETAAKVACAVAVPGHGPTVTALDDLVQLNRELVLDVADRIVEFAAEPSTADALLTQLLKHGRADVADAPSFFLLHPTIYAYLTHLERQGRMRHEVRDCQSRWVAV
jgi:glyoxylase-like metal-dependent hydrolase (beta-lactamase superfamily II)